MSNNNVIYGAPEGQDARVLIERARAAMREDRAVMHVALDDARGATLKELIQFFAPDVKILEFPAWDCLPYDRVSPHNDIVARRVFALTGLLGWAQEKERYPRILLTTVNAVSQRVMPRAALAGASLIVKQGGRLDIAHLQEFLANSGYTRTQTVREAGEYALRGGIIDVFPPGTEEPVRIDLFGDEVESIKAFDPLSQRSQNTRKEFMLQPVSEFSLDAESIDHFRAAYRAAFGVVQSGDPLYEAVSDGRRYNGMDHWLPLFYDTLETVFDYAPRAEVILDHHAHEAYHERILQIRDFYQARKTLEAAGKKKPKSEGAFVGSVYHPLPVEALYLEEAEMTARTADAYAFSPFGAPSEETSSGARKGRDFADIRSMNGDVIGEVKKYVDYLKKPPHPNPLPVGERGQYTLESAPSPQGGEGRGEGGYKLKPVPESIEFARTLRQSETKAEDLLWNQLRNRSLQDCKFRRQHPVGSYFADFACLEHKLIVELDGAPHDQRVAHDEKRTAYLESEGFKVLRFMNEDVKSNLEGVVMEIGKALSSFPDVKSPLTPTLSPKGERGQREEILPQRGGGTQKRKVLITCTSEGSKQRLKAMMEAGGIEGLVNCDSAEDLKKLKPFQIGFAILALEHGFVADDLAVLTEGDILGDRLTRKPTKRKKSDNFLREVSSLAEGDLVVHTDHGVGKFLGLETVKAGKIFHDCLKIEYAGGDKLYVPVENIEVLSRFGADEGTVQLDKLGGAGWQARKARVKKDLMVMADGLLKIAAERLLKKVTPIVPSLESYNAFVSGFSYTETEDQERAIAEVLEDLASDHPMDRLVCGDVGFGKTEVALRAAYVAAMDGCQVAVVVPTTLLARQHYNNFQKRFAGTGLRIGQLSRLVTARDAALVKDGLADGGINIVIGTHALFGQGMKFANLGLLILDEEQRFGVKQKERLKEIKNNVHVLTLTATPIPRTLQMSLTGVKEMSLITTPPVDRLAVRTFVMPFDAMVIREALLREHYRGGQSFYVCPRIKDMPEIEDILKELVPEIRVITAHGQMTPTELEDRMSAFTDGHYDVLLATNIIESGIDIASANTMIVHRADMFGLAQLYQIRGRIGRSKVRAYAYLTYPPLEKLNAVAQKRLEVMETLDTLGSGFQLASHDMDIRGGGNLLGDQQSGHIREVGVELYQQMLEEAVSAVRAGVDMDYVPQESWSPQINIGTSILIPEHYVPDLGVRMSLYRRLADLESHEDIENFAAELIDRFGDIPPEVQNLLDIVGIKQLCKRAGIAQVEAGPKGVVIGYHKDSPPDIMALMHWMNSKRGSVKLRPDQKIIATHNWETAKERVRGVQNLMQELVGLT